MYLLYPEADYMALTQEQGEGWKVTLSRNPWRLKPGPHLGHVATSLGGGGHEHVGAVNVERRAEARNTLQRFLAVLDE
jgi:hypothetical protein